MLVMEEKTPTTLKSDDPCISGLEQCVRFPNEVRSALKISLQKIL
jgi:hypothetical protein